MHVAHQSETSSNIRSFVRSDGFAGKFLPAFLCGREDYRHLQSYASHAASVCCEHSIHLCEDGALSMEAKQMCRINVRALARFYSSSLMRDKPWG